MERSEAVAGDLGLELVDLDQLTEADLDDSMAGIPSATPVTADPLTGTDGATQSGMRTDQDETGVDLGVELPSSQWNTDSAVWDEVATKIDLARAYMEMEDPDAARGILEEVAEEGNDRQREEAKQMMAQMA